MNGCEYRDDMLCPTQGPWVFNGTCDIFENQFKFDHRWEIKSAKTGQLIMCNYADWVPRNKKDWVLMAAAPEMLEALEAAVECGMVPITSAKDGGAAALTRHAHVADMIRSVIAKTKG
jgi:hypothetical protein